MCDYDYSYQEISRETRKTRKPHRCQSCGKVYPAGTVMTHCVGKTDGEFGAYYACDTCIWAFGQHEDSLFHICWNWSYDGSHDYEQQKYDYIRSAFERGIQPTIFGVMAEIKAFRLAEELEEELSQPV